MILCLYILCWGYRWTTTSTDFYMDSGDQNSGSQVRTIGVLPAEPSSQAPTVFFSNRNQFSYYAIQLKTILCRHKTLYYFSHGLLLLGRLESYQFSPVTVRAQMGWCDISTLIMGEAIPLSSSIGSCPPKDLLTFVLVL